MHGEINVRFELSIDDDKTIPLAVLAEFVTDQSIESVLLEELVENSRFEFLNRPMRLDCERVCS